MHAVRIFREPYSVESRLQPFGVTVEELVAVVEQIVAARNNVVSVDARTAAGTQAYLAGVRHLRLLFLQRGYEIDFTNGVESVVDPFRGTKIIYQSVDQACVPMFGPKAINGKGPASESQVNRAQGCLFRAEDLPEVAPSDIEGLNTAVWFLCVSVDGDDVRAELSLPAIVSGGNFEGFLERIFILNDGEWDGRAQAADMPDDEADYDFSIVRR